MARGSIAKEAITQKILDTFEGSFVYGKEIRIPYSEDGNRVEIKITLTCAKENVGGNDNDFTIKQEDAENIMAKAVSAIPTEQEKANIADLMSRLGL